MFVVISILVLLAAGLAVAFRRFRVRHPSVEGNILYAAVAREFARWLGRRVPECLKAPAPGGWAAWIKGWGLWRLPLFEKWLLIGLYGSFLYLAFSGFFFAVFIPRGLFGFPLVLHVFAGAIFAVCLTAVAYLKARHYSSSPAAVSLPADLAAVRAIRIKARTPELAKGLFWIFLAAGVSLAASALLPMLPWFHYQGQVVLFDWHRWSALISLVAAVGFADLELFAPRPE